MSLKKDIVAWDGRSAEDISAVFQSHSSKPGFVGELLQLFESQETQKGASWLLKAWFEAGNSLESSQITRICKTLGAISHWESKLHILQCLLSIPISQSNLRRVESFLRDSLLDQNKFVRAWTYNGWHLLAEQYPEFRKEVDEFFEMAMRDEAASVKARIRNLDKSW